MNAWERTIKQANDAFARGDEALAGRLYRSACARALLMLGPSNDFESAIIATTVSHQNLADLYFRQGDNALALRTYRTLIELLDALPTRHHWVGVHEPLMLRLRSQISTDLLSATRHSVAASEQARALIEG